MMNREALIARGIEALDGYLSSLGATTPEHRLEALSVLAMETSRLMGRIEQAARKEAIRQARGRR